MKRWLFVLSTLLSFTAPLCSVAQSVGTSSSFKGPVVLQQIPNSLKFLTSAAF